MQGSKQADSMHYLKSSLPSLGRYLLKNSSVRLLIRMSKGGQHEFRHLAHVHMCMCVHIYVCFSWFSFLLFVSVCFGLFICLLEVGGGMELDGWEGTERRWREARSESITWKIIFNFKKLNCRGDAVLIATLNC